MIPTQWQYRHYQDPHPSDQALLHHYQDPHLYFPQHYRYYLSL